MIFTMLIKEIIKIAFFITIIIFLEFNISIYAIFAFMIII